jgi:hypothetical protein
MSRLHFAAGCLLGTFLFVAAAVEAGEQPPTPESEAIAELRQEIAELRKLVLELKKQVEESQRANEFGIIPLPQPRAGSSGTEGAKSSGPQAIQLPPRKPEGHLRFPIEVERAMVPLIPSIPKDGNRPLTPGRWEKR